jgi:hypothetical protein
MLNRLTKRIHPLSKVILIVGITCIFYGFLSKIIPIYFFWESTTVGIIIVLLGLIIALLKDLKNNNKKLLKKIIIGIICLSLLSQFLMFMFLLDSKAYQKSKEYFNKNESIKIELGNLKNITLLPYGSMTSISNQYGAKANVNLNFILKGEKCYKTISIYLNKDFNTTWTVYHVE